MIIIDIHEENCSLKIILTILLLYMCDLAHYFQFEQLKSPVDYIIHQM